MFFFFFFEFVECGLPRIYFVNSRNDGVVLDCHDLLLVSLAMTNIPLSLRRGLRGGQIPKHCHFIVIASKNECKRIFVWQSIKSKSQTKKSQKKYQKILKSIKDFKRIIKISKKK
ncbi:hypothetical protein [Helicobacter sp. T3_23-1056]